MIDRIGTRWRALPPRSRLASGLLVLLLLLTSAFLAGARVSGTAGVATPGTWTFGPIGAGNPSPSGSPTDAGIGSPSPSDGAGPSASPAAATSSPHPTPSTSGKPSTTASPRPTPTPTPAGPAAPTGLKAVGLGKAGNLHINLSWTASAGAVSYRVYRGTTRTSLTRLATDVLTTTYKDTPPQSGTYYYQASAVGVTGVEGPRSATVQVAF